jgi:LuxR family glucitol operon transcriptional activator
MGNKTLQASAQGRAKIQQAREAKGWTAKEENDIPLKEASKCFIRQYALANQWEANDRRWLKHFEQLFRVEPDNPHSITTIIAKSRQGSFLERIEHLIETGEVLAKGISYGTWSRFAAQNKSHSIKARTFKIYCQILGLNWEEIAEVSVTSESENPEKPIPLPQTAPTPLIAPEKRSSPYHNLPVRYHTALIGRNQELQQLLQRLSNSENSYHISVEGMGGAGKTSLVLETAYYCLKASCGEPTTLPAPSFDAIIFTSAKQQHLIGNHILQRHRRERTLNDIFRAIFRTLDCPGSLPADFEQQLELIDSRLQELQTLLIVDNLETIEDQEAVLSFLYELPSTVKVVITTRLRGVFGVSIYLEGLPPDEGLRLIEHQANEQSIQLNPEQFDVIYQRTNGLPLGIVYEIGQLSVYGTSTETVSTRLTPANNNLAYYCFEDSLQRLRGQPAHEILMGMALFTKSATPDAIAQVALATSNPVHALAQLYKLRLVMQREKRYDMHPLTREYVLTELKSHPEFEQQARERWINWYLQFSQAYAPQDWKQWNEYQNLEQEWENLQAVIDWCIQHNRYEEVKKFWQHIKGYTYVRGYWHERLTWIDWLLQIAQQYQDKAMLLEVLVDKGWTLALMWMGKPEQLVEVDALFEQVSHLQENEDLSLQLELTIERAVLSIHQKKFDAACQLLNQAKDLLQQVQLESSKRLSQQIRIDYYQAEIWFGTKNYKQAKIGYQKALKQARIAQWQQMEVYILNWLADVILAEKGELDEAENLLKISMPIALERKDKMSIAFHQRSWAHLENLRGNVNQFQFWAMKAKAEFEGLGMLAEAQEMQSWLNNK